MIEKMNKYAFMVYHKEYETFLKRLRSLGVVHVKQSNSTHDNTIIQQLILEKKRVKTQLDFLSGKIAERKDKTEFPAKAFLSRNESERLVYRIEELRDKLSKCQSTLAQLHKELAILSIWGDFSYANIERLREAGYAVTFYTCPTSRKHEILDSNNDLFVISDDQSTVFFIVIAHSGAELQLNADLAKLPPRDYQHTHTAIEEVNNEKESIENELSEIACKYYDSLKNLHTEIENESEWNNVLLQTEQKVDNKLSFIEGWIPANRKAVMEASLSDAGYYYCEMAITDDDNIPIKLKNNRFAKLFEPLTQLYSLPNYKEFDPTPLFAPFFMLFFGLCLGDGGYGLLLILASLIFKRKANASMKPIMTLLTYFGVTTMVIGAVTGSFFGLSLIEVESLAAIKKYFITNDNLMIIALIIGFFHVLYAKFVAAMKIHVQRGWRYSLSAFAWIGVILLSACLYGLYNINVALPSPFEYLLYGTIGLSGATALFYNTPDKNIFLNFGSGLWATYNTVSGLVGDILSYIRLYAIGLTGALLGGVFNTMAIDMTASLNPFVRWLPMLLILLLGHALNIGISLISSFVHSLRLIYVEYYKNSEFEGGGIDYKPFRKI